MYLNIRAVKPVRPRFVEIRGEKFGRFSYPCRVTQKRRFLVYDVEELNIDIDIDI